MSDGGADPSYRADIDGLRAFAVLAVIGFHAFPNAVKGGFIGVDVFFVLSGYLITGILLRNLDAGRYTIADFYARRVRRIFPALGTTLLLSLLAAPLLLLPDECKALGRQAAAGAGFLANVLFYSEGGYFDDAAEDKPLLHLWSLGIEEQFYVVWPLLCAALHRRAGGSSRRAVTAGIGAVVVVSFAWNLATAKSAPTAAYFLPMARAWELGLGALLACVPPPPSLRGRGPLAEAAGLLGAGLLGASLILIDSGRTFPGTWALLPTVGTMLVVTAAGSTLNRRLLSQRWLVAVGLISYPLYLWHWVMLALVRLRTDGTPSKGARLLAVLGAFALAYLTYKLVEQPVRFGPRRPSAPRIALALLAIALLGVGTDLSDGWAMRYPEPARTLARYRHRPGTEYRCLLEPGQQAAELPAECVDEPTATAKATPPPLYVVWGDSHAASLAIGLRERKERRGDIRLAQLTASACPPLLGVEPADRPGCRAINDAVLARLRALRPSVLVIAAAWPRYLTARATGGTAPLGIDALTATLEAARGVVGDGRVVLVGSLPHWQVAEPKVALRLLRDTGALPPRTRLALAELPEGSEARLSAMAADHGARFLSPTALLCAPDGCRLAADAAGRSPMAFDRAHLTAEGAALLVEQAADILGLPSPPERGH